MTRPMLDGIRIASPCTADWSAMAGDERSRHCAACGRRVYDLSAMTHAEATALIGRPGRSCVRLYRRADGTVLTADCPVGRRDVRQRRTRRAWLAAALLGIWAASERAVEAAWRAVGEAPPAGLFDQLSRLQSALGERIAVVPPPEMTMGEVLPPDEALGYDEVPTPGPSF